VSNETWPKSFYWFADKSDIITFFYESGDNKASTLGSRRSYEYISNDQGNWLPCETPAEHTAAYVAWDIDKKTAIAPTPTRHPADIAFAAEIDAAFRETNRQEIQLRYQRAVDRLNKAVGIQQGVEA
jgi:hypothetical protein